MKSLLQFLFLSILFFHCTVEAFGFTSRRTLSLRKPYQNNKNYSILKLNAKKTKGPKGLLSEEAKLDTISDSKPSATSAESDDSANESDPATEAGVDLDLSTRVKLKEEIASPFRKLRQFFYAGAGIAGCLGTVTAIPQLLFAIQDGGDEVSTQVLNIVIDVGAIVGAVALWDKDAKDEKVKLERFTEKELRSTYKLSPSEVEDREKELSLLPVQIQISEKDENSTRIVPFSDLQLKGKQHVIIFAGKRSIVKDAVISARIEGVDLFNNKETFVIPVILDNDQIQDESAGTKGFGAAKESLMTAPYIGIPTQIKVWERYLMKEIELAKSQGESDIESKGLVIAVKRNGKVVRRGVGLPPWKQVVEEFQDKPKQ